VNWATREIRPADLLRVLLGALLLVERLALADFEPLLRAELRRERTVFEPVLRVAPPERLLPARFDPVVLVWGICPLSCK
jgi:hypothetical protein